MDNKLEYIRQCADRYTADLKDNIMPFWIEHGLDPLNGGIYTCLDRDGTLMDHTKSVWFQGRFGYISALAYNKIEHNQEWLAASKSCIDFIERHCIDSDSHLFFTVTAEGAPVQKRRYVFSECFAAMAMAEYAKAAASEEYAQKALAMFVNTERMLSTDGFLPPKTFEPSRGHSITMMLINVALAVKQVVSDKRLDERIERSIGELERYFVHPEFEALLETVGTNGEFIDTCAGRTINPGHSIETSWFLLAAAEQLEPSLRKQTERLATKILDWSWKWGWDEQYGGIINFRDCRNFPPQDYSQDMKFWWPQCEAIIATLYAYKVTGEPQYLDRHRMANEWAYSHLPDSDYPEWYGYLHRDGTVAQPAKGNLFKGPFHIPRMMIVAGELCRLLTE